MSDKKIENKLADCFTQESFSGNGSREKLVDELRVRAERFYERATLEEIREITLVVKSLLAARGLLPEQASKLIN